MVVRLGHTETQVVNSQRYRILQGQALHLRYATDNSTVAVRAWARVRYDNGEDDVLFIADQTLTGDPPTVRVLRPSDVARMDGWVTDALVEMLTADIKRGQVYVKLFMDPFGPVLCSDYCYSDFGQVALGTYIQSGPGGGIGYLRVATLKAEALPASFTVTLAVSNIIRLVHSLVWYYHCDSGVASRVLQCRLRQPLGAVPTGYDATDATLTWEAADLTLTADQDGSVFADQERTGINDNGTIAIDNQASAPTPFPLLVSEDNVTSLRFNVASEESGDLDVVYALYEDWVLF